MSSISGPSCFFGVSAAPTPLVLVAGAQVTSDLAPLAEAPPVGHPGDSGVGPPLTSPAHVGVVAGG